jgi:hypothetical protein
MEDEKLTEKYNALYLEIIMRYKDAIELGETLYVAELPKLVTPADENVVAAVSKILSTFHIYIYDENFLEAVQQAHKFVKDEIVTVSPPIQFWLRPGQVLMMQAGDTFDKAVLLCSMMIALGNMSSKIVTTVNDSGKRHVVCCEYKGEQIAVDLEDGVSKSASREELLQTLGIKEGKLSAAYEFNDKMYNDLI